MARGGHAINEAGGATSSMDREQRARREAYDLRMMGIRLGSGRLVRLARLTLLGLGACVSAPAPVAAPSPTPPAPSEPAAPAPWLAAEVSVPGAPESEPSTRGAIVPAGLRGVVLNARWSPDGSFLAVATTEKIVAIVDPRTAEVRAARRVRVRREASVMLTDLDDGRLLVTHGEYDDASALVWDLVADTWQVVAERGEGLALTPRGALVRTDEEGVVHVDVAGTRVPIGRSDDADAIGDRILLAEPEGTVVYALPEDGANEARRIGRVAGVLGSVRPRGGSFATTEGDLVRVARLSDGEVVFERAFEGLRDARWDTRDRFVVEVERDPHHARHRFDGRTGEPIDVVPAPRVEGGDLQLDDDVTVVIADDGAIDRRSADGSSVTRWLEPWSDELIDQGYDPASGDELNRRFHALSPDRTRVLLNDTGTTRVLDTADGRVVATLPRDDSGATSVWGVKPTPRGLVVWGRSHVSHWGPRGARVFECRGSGFFFGDDEHPGWSNGAWTCVDGRRAEFPAWDEENGQPAWAAGLVGDGVLVFSAGQLLRVDPRTLRATRRARAPRDFALECYEEGCDVGTHRLGNGAWLTGGEPGFLDASLRFRPVDLERTALVGGARVVAIDERRSRVLDASGRVLREGGPAPLHALSPDGALFAHGNDDGVVIVERTDDGAELVRVESELGILRALRESALIGATDEETIVWHLPTGARRVSFPAGAHFAIDARGDRLALCREGRLELHSVVEGRRLAELGTCELADSVDFVGDDRFVAVPSRTQVTLFRVADGRRLVIHGAGDAAFAEDGERVFVMGADRALRWRAAGPIATAPTSAIGDRLDPTLVARFFAP